MSASEKGIVLPEDVEDPRRVPPRPPRKRRGGRRGRRHTRRVRKDARDLQRRVDNAVAVLRRIENHPKVSDDIKDVAQAGIKYDQSQAKMRTREDDD